MHNESGAEAMRTEQINIRLTPGEKKRLRTLARKANYESEAMFLRALLRWAWRSRSTMHTTTEDKKT